MFDVSVVCSCIAEVARLSAAAAPSIWRARPRALRCMRQRVTIYTYFSACTTSYMEHGRLGAGGPDE
eukprot:1283806-Prymnesium_polylepis.1